MRPDESNTGIGSRIACIQGGSRQMNLTRDEEDPSIGRLDSLLDNLHDSHGFPSRGAHARDRSGNEDETPSA